MKKFISIIVICALGFGMSACKSKNSTKSETNRTTNKSIHTPKNSLDWPGIYTGTVPCADCAGIYTQITLKEDNTYSLQTKYLGKGKSGENLKGTFQWNNAETIVTLSGLKEKSGPYLYQVGENRLIQLDKDGKVITGELASNYVLIKVNKDLVEKKWKLIELNGAALSTKNPQPAEAFIIFQINDNRVSGNSGCNNFTGTYKRGTGSDLHFSNMVSTRKLCINMTVENQMNQVFQNVDSYTLQNATLSLNQGETSLARFVISE